MEKDINYLFQVSALFDQTHHINSDFFPEFIEAIGISESELFQERQVYQRRVRLPLYLTAEVGQRLQNILHYLVLFQKLIPLQLMLRFDEWTKEHTIILGEINQVSKSG